MAATKTDVSFPLKDEDILSLAEAREHFRAVTGHKPSTTAVAGWMRGGIPKQHLGKVKDRVVLESMKVGTRRMTSKQAIERFLAATSK